jgi:23S rRNA pseudouridine1911/1915/1917 synthase
VGAPAASSRWTWVVSSSLAEERADRAILGALESGEGTWEGEPQLATRSQLKRWIEEGRVKSGVSSRVSSEDEPVKANARLRAGARVSIELPPPRALEALAEDLPLDILFQDDHLLVVNKPAGLTVHPSTTQTEGTLVNALLHHVKDLSGIGGVLRPGIVHRLDKDTSGALVVTKTDAAHRVLADVFARHEIERVYWALCYGTTERLQLRFESTIGRNPADRKKMAMNVRDGRRAVTHARRLEAYGVPSRSPFASWLELRLETGRTHQIRVHLTANGNSLLGDPVYGTASARQPKWLALPEDVRAAVERLPGQALHARVLGFKHPVTGEPLRFEAEPPRDFSDLLKTLQRYR